MNGHNNAYRILTGAFVVFVACFAWPFLLDRTGTWFVIWVVSAVVYLVQLARVVAATGRRAWLWVLCALVTGPVGFIVSYIAITMIVRSAESPGSPPDAH